MITKIGCVAGLLIGIGIGALAALLIAKKFYGRKTSKLLHDLKNPLFLIQSYTWDYLDKLKKKKLSASEMTSSADKMAETLNRQAKKAIEILKNTKK